MEVPYYYCPVNFYSAYVLNSSVFKNKFLNPPPLIQEEECKSLKIIMYDILPLLKRDIA